MEHRLYVEGLKKALRSRSITYADLAKSLRMTESGVKKMLNAKDISFQRVLNICKVIDVLPSQLFALSEKSLIPTFYLSDKQQEALIKDRRLLAVYWLLTVERKTAAQISLMQKLSPSELKIIFQKLVTLDLILQKKNQFYRRHQGKFRWPDDSKLAKILNEEWSQRTLKKSLSLKPDQPGRHRFSALKLTADSYLKLLQKISDLFDETALISEREEISFSSENLTDFTILLASAGGGVFE